MEGTHLRLGTGANKLGIACGDDEILATLIGPIDGFPGADDRAEQLVCLAHFAFGTLYHAGYGGMRKVEHVADARGHVAWPQEQHIDPVHRGDLLYILYRLLGFDLTHNEALLGPSIKIFAEPRTPT